MRTYFSIALAAWLVAPVTANAVLVDFGTAEAVTLRTCIPGNTACDNVTAPASIVYGGLPGAPASSASTSLPGYGSATGSVELSGAIGAPILRALAIGELDKRANTNSVALQRYTYTGLDPATRIFSGSLTYSQTLSGAYPPGAGNGVSVSIDVFTLPTAMIEAGSTAESNFAALVGASLLPGYATLGWDQFIDQTTNLAGEATVEVAVTLNPGDSIFVWAFLQTPASNGSTVDAWSTFITGWDNTADLVPAIRVPEPAGTVLLSLGAVGLLLLRRRPRAASTRQI